MKWDVRLEQVGGQPIAVDRHRATLRELGEGRFRSLWSCVERRRAQRTMGQQEGQ